MPLVNYWGFGYKDAQKRFETDQAIISNLVKNTGIDKIGRSEENNMYCFSKTDSIMELDFSAIAKGYAVDLIGDLLEKRNCQDYFINIGGELLVKGKSHRDKKWVLGINYPDTAAKMNDIYARLEIKRGAVASSGNYRNYYSSPDGVVAHTINPKSGMATPSDLLSATIIMDNCTDADAYATACMAMGYKKAKKLIEQNRDIDGMLIFIENDRLSHFISPGLKNNINVE